MRSLNFFVPLDALFEPRRKAPATVSDIVKAVRGLMRERAAKEAIQPDENKTYFDQRLDLPAALLPSPNPHAQAAKVIMVKQYQYRSIPISVSKYVTGKWIGTVGFLYRTLNSPNSNQSSIVETPPYEAETLALADATELVDETLTRHQR